MRYRRFEITNFKGIRHLSIDLEERQQGRIHTLVGLNESGKTTILEAIDYFYRGGTSDGLRSIAKTIKPDENDVVPIGERANFNGKVTITAEIDLDEKDRIEVRRYLQRTYKLQLKELPSSIKDCRYLQL